MPQENLPGVLGLEGGPMLRWSPRGSTHLADGASSRPVGPLPAYTRIWAVPQVSFKLMFGDIHQGGEY